MAYSDVRVIGTRYPQDTARHETDIPYTRDMSKEQWKMKIMGMRDVEQPGIGQEIREREAKLRTPITSEDALKVCLSNNNYEYHE